MTDDVLFDDFNKLTEDECIKKWGNFEIFVHIQPAVFFQAVNNKWKKVVTALFVKGVNINATTSYGTTALIECIRTGNSEMAELLINFNADITYHNCSALFSAYWFYKFDLVKLMIEKVVKFNPGYIDSVDFQNDTLLITAAIQGHLDMVKYFVKKGANMYCKNRNHKTAIEAAMLSLTNCNEDMAKINLNYATELFEVINFLFSQQIKTVAAIFPHLPQYIILWITDWLPGSTYVPEREKVEIIERMQRSIIKIE